MTVALYLKSQYCISGTERWPCLCVQMQPFAQPAPQAMAGQGMNAYGMYMGGNLAGYAPPVQQANYGMQPYGMANMYPGQQAMYGGGYGPPGAGYAAAPGAQSAAVFPGNTSAYSQHVHAAPIQSKYPAAASYQQPYGGAGAHFLACA